MAGYAGRAAAVSGLGVHGVREVHRVRSRLLCGFVMVLAACGGSDIDGPDPELWNLRSRSPRSVRARLSNIRYDLTFAIPASASEPIAGTAAIRLRSEGHRTAARARLRAGRRPPHVGDRRRQAGHVSRRQRPHRHPAARARAGENAVEIAFRAGDAALNRNADFLYTLFVPARAHLAFPCFDQPDLKARYTLALDVSRRTGRRSRTAPRSAREDRRRPDCASRVRRDAAAPDLSVRLRRRASSRSRRPSATAATFRMFHRETDAAKVARNRDAIFDLHAAALALARGLHRHPVSVRQVRLRARSRRSSSAAWSTPARSSTTPSACCSTSRRRRTSCSAAPASSRTRPRTCGSAISSRCAGSTTCG